MNLFKSPLTVSFAEVLPFLRMNRDPSAPEKELINHYLLKIKQIAQPCGIWRTFSLKSVLPTQIILTDASLYLEGEKTIRHFQNCAQITLLATTLGAAIDQLLTELSPTQPARALIADAVASAAIESFTTQLDHYLARQIKHHGFFPTTRFSPGYGDWPLIWQKEFLASLDGAQIGLTITPSYLLQPVKSITAAIGWRNLT